MSAISNVVIAIKTVDEASSVFDALKVGPSFEKKPTQFLGTLTAEQLGILIKLRQRFEAFKSSHGRILESLSPRRP